MDPAHIIFLAVVGVIGGAISAVVGGASLVTYPALLAVGIHPLSAVICTNASLVPSNLVAALADRTQLPPFDRAFAGMVVASVVGAGIGAVLLLATPARVFEMVVPLLLGLATVLFTFSERIAGWLRARAARRGRTVTFSVTGLKFLVPVSIYGGYFGSGLGILLLGVLSIATGGNYRSANVTKNLIGGLNTLVAALVYIAQDAVPWPPTLALAAGGIAGGLIGAYAARVMPRAIIRTLVVGFGVLLTLTLAIRYWL